jgi:hypothetical protein
MTLTRVDEIQRMFEEIGLGRSEDRARFIELARVPQLTDIGSETTSREQLFIRLEANTPEAEEPQHG